MITPVVELILENLPLKNQTLLNARLELFAGRVSVLVGENGLGKSSLFFYLKIKQQELFPGRRVFFMDQRPLSGQKNASASDLFNFLIKDDPVRCAHLQMSQYQLIDEVGFRIKMDRPINKLSGGENQTLKWLLLFFLKSEVFILDEPSNHLDQQKKNFFSQRLQSHLQLHQSSALLCDHQVAWTTVFKEAIIFEGRKIEQRNKTIVEIAAQGELR